MKENEKYEFLNSSLMKVQLWESTWNTYVCIIIALLKFLVTTRSLDKFYYLSNLT